MVSERKKYLKNIFFGPYRAQCIRNRQSESVMTTAAARERRRIVMKNVVWRPYSTQRSRPKSAVDQLLVVPLRKADADICDY
jgi:hypothetical protein